MSKRPRQGDLFAASKNAEAFGESGDVSRPQHDELMLRLDCWLRSASFETLKTHLEFPFLQAQRPRWTIEVIRDEARRYHRPSGFEQDPDSARNKAWLAELNTSANIQRAELYPSCDQSPRLQKIEWEVLIKKWVPRYKTHEDITVGYADLAAHFSRETLVADFKFFLDKAPICVYKKIPENVVYHFEVKTARASLGETIRQVKLYRDLCDARIKWVVVLPIELKSVWEPILRGEGILCLVVE